jgi:hypothetical protein
MDDAIGPARAFEDDDEFLAELRRVAAEIDSVPDEVHAAAHAAITTRTIEQELADLIADSAAAADDDQVATFERVRTGTAGTQASRLLSFESGGIQIDLEVSDHGDRLDLIGQVSGVAITECVLEFASGAPLALDVDDVGRFLAYGVRRGPVRARLRSATDALVVTAWVTL